MIIVYGLIVVAGLYLSCYVAYWLLLLGTHYLVKTRSQERGAATTRFAIVIPAHNEEILLPRLLASARKQSYPADNFKIIVIADNCTDGTARLAQLPGVNVLERFNDENRGKGHAIKWAIENIRLGDYDAILIVDADCVMDPSVLGFLDGDLRERPVMQCYSGVANADESWFTRLLDVSRTINNEIYHPAKIRLGLSSQLLGTGMCFCDIYT